VGRWNGKSCKILSISSQDRFDNRANVVKKLGNVATASVGADSTFWVTGSTDHIAPEVAKKINDYLDESHSRTLAVVPLAIRPPDVPDLDMNKRNKKVRKLGAIILEYFDDDVTEESIRDDMALVVEQSELALENARKHGEIFLQPVLKKVGWLQQTLFGDHRKKTLTGLAALTLLTLAMIFVPYELKMNVSGVLQPEARRHVYAISKGVVKSVNFKDEQQVKTGELLFQLEDLDRKQQLDARLTERKRLEKTAVELHALMVQAPSEEFRNRYSSDLTNTKGQLDQVNDLIAHDLKVMQETLQVPSPIDGTVVTWDVKRRLEGFPVEPNQSLVTIAKLDGNWQLEVDIPHIKEGYVARALQKAKEDGKDEIHAEFALSTNPSKTFEGKLKRLSIRPFTDSAGLQQYRAIVAVDPDQLDVTELKPGAGGTVKIHCGKVPLYRACFQQVIDWCQVHMWWF
jgi:multidrug efflux pump subunit AcrA (membrane-fusion protein)